MKKQILSLLLILIGLTGCSGPSIQTDEPTPTPDTQVALKVLVPQGATALAVMKLDESVADIDYVAGSDVLAASLVSPESEYDIIIAPTNLGAKLASNQKSDYKMAAVLTWGNLFIAGDANKSMDENATIALFGDGAVPGLIYEMCKPESTMNEIYYGAVNEALAQLLAKEADFALLAEPALSAALAKDESLSVVSDLQDNYQEINGFEGYPQAAIFVKEDAIDDPSFMALFEQIQANIQVYDQDTSLAVADVEAVGADVVGVPSSAIIKKAYPGLNIRFVWASDVKDQLETFLSTFGISDPDTYVIELNE